MNKNIALILYNTKLFLNYCIRIVEKNPTKFKIDNKELTSRRTFIDNTRNEVKVS